MLKKTIPTLATAMLLSIPALASDPTPTVADTKFEIGVGVNGDIEGSKDDPLHSNGGLLLQASYRFLPNWSVTGIYTYSGNVGTAYSDLKADINRYIVDLNYDFAPEETYSVYVFVGGGYEDTTKTEYGGYDRDGFLFGGGLGMRIYLSTHFGLNFSGMYKYNDEADDSAVLLNAAVTYRFN